MDLEKLKKEAEAEFADEELAEAKEEIKELLRKRASAQQVLKNIEREINDVYAELGKGSAT